MIDLDQARSLLKRAMETKGRNFRYVQPGYGGCFYEPYTGESAAQQRINIPIGTDDVRRTTGCLIGVALDLAGETRQHGSRGIITSLAEEYAGADNPMCSYGAAQYFRVAQSAQDTGRTWGEAYDRAEASVGVTA